MKSKEKKKEKNKTESKYINEIYFLYFTSEQKKVIDLIYDFSFDWGYSIPSYTHGLLLTLGGFSKEVTTQLRTEVNIEEENIEIFSQKLIGDVHAKDPKFRDEAIIQIVNLLKRSFVDIVLKEIEENYEDRLKLSDMGEMEVKGWRIRRLNDLSDLIQEMFDCTN